jgi:hypothetical protein
MVDACMLARLHMLDEIGCTGAVELGLVRLAGSQPVSSAFLSHQFSTSYQPPASQQYFSLTINQPQPPATSQPNEVYIFDYAVKHLRNVLRRICSNSHFT